jgi:hypothetical protein
MSVFRAWIIGSGFALLVGSPANACNPLLSTANPRPTIANTQANAVEIIAALAPSPLPVLTMHICNIGTVGVRISPANTGTPFVLIPRDECKVVTASTLFLRTASGVQIPAGQIAYCVQGPALRP